MVYKIINSEHNCTQYTIMDFIEGLTWEIIDCNTQEGKKRSKEISAPRASNYRNNDRSSEISTSQSRDINF
ncbi:hypothetical protein LCGC14_1652630, partial [marine sediment metagenome]